MKSTKHTFFEVKAGKATSRNPTQDNKFLTYLRTIDGEPRHHIVQGMN